MLITCMKPDLDVTTELPAAVKEADLVALVRLDSIQHIHVKLEDGCQGSVTNFRATIINATKNRRSERLGSIGFVLVLHRGQFDIGEDYIVFLQWHPGTSAYRVIGRSYVVPVRAGRVILPSRDTDEPLADALTALRSISSQQ